MFHGFPEPTANWYRLPNSWFADWQDLRATAKRARIAAPLKVTEYVIKWTWGYGNFSDPVQLSWNDFQHGRQRYGRRLDQGTGLSRGGLQAALRQATDLGLLDPTAPAEPGASHTYLPRLQPTAAPPAAAAPPMPWTGFAPPRSNFFKVPQVWTDLTAELSSAVTILTVEYLMRHTWGWATWDGGPCWLTLDEIAQGRRYRSPEREGARYDSGIGYSNRAITDAVREALDRGLLVWHETTTGRREFALHLQGMRVDVTGRWSPPPTATHPETEIPVPTPVPPPISANPAPAQIPPITDLAHQVAALTHRVQQLTAALQAAGVTLPDIDDTRPPVEPNRPPQEAIRPPLEPTRPGLEATRPLYNKTLSPDTPSRALNNTAQASTAAAPAAALPQAVQTALQHLGFYGKKSRVELRTAYAHDPARIAGWIRRLLAAPTRYANPAGFLLQTVVREGAPLPAPVSSTEVCPTCGGSQFILRDGKACPCPDCASEVRYEF